MRRLIMCAVVLGISAFGFAGIQPFELRIMNPTSSEAGAVYKSIDHPNAIYVFENYFLNCPYCNDNAPNVDRLAEEFKDEPRVQVLDLGIDRTDAEYEEWIRRHRPNHPVLNDGARVLTRQLGTSRYPTAYVVKSGEVIFKTTGVWSPQTFERIRSLLRSTRE